MILRLLRTCALVFTAIGILVSCATNDDNFRPNYGPTLADLPEQKLPDEPNPVPITSLDQIEESYRSALEVAVDLDLRHKILTRLADIEMSRGETEQATVAEEKAYFNDAISMYQALLKKNENSATGIDTTKGNERLLYQLSKAYALDGRIEESNDILNKLVTTFPDSAFAAEADFRRAELAFSGKRYARAESLYTKVMAAGKTTPFYINAVYMQGWSRFKQSHYHESILSFTEVLDLTLVEGKNFGSLSNSKKNTAKDTLRIMSIVFSYMDGASSITETYAELGPRHYQFMLYANLGELYYEKDRYRDSADTYLHYVEKFPSTEHSPAFSVKAIDVYQQGGFPSLVLPAKEGFVANYGVNSQYWASRDDAKRVPLKPYLKLYLTELSSYYHAEAQALDQALVAYNKQRAAGKKAKKKPENSQANYLRAAKLYGEYVVTFPKDAQTAEMTFLQAEAYYSAGMLAESVDAFELVAYQYIDGKRGADAAYSAVLIMNELIESTADAQTPEAQKAHQAWVTRKTNSAVSFSDYYAADPRAVAVLTKAAQELFEQKQLERSATIAQRLTVWQPQQSLELQKTAWLILAHSQFDQNKFPEAEASYRELLGRIGPQDKLRPQVVERIAASVYRQAETQIAADDKAGAVERLLSIRDVAPGSEIAITAQYDATNYLIEAKDWARAEQELKHFEKNYPKHELTKTLQPKFALVYQETQQWAKAAAILAAMSLSGDPEAKRTSLYLSAELYERSGDTKRAIKQYRQYANNYPQPFDIATEARFHLVELYDKTRDYGKKDFWLKKLIDEDARAGSQRTPRSKSLAAMAMSKFADDEYQAFQKIKLKLPIKKSMKKKKAAMDRTLKYYKKIMDFGIAEYVTQASHRIAQIYGTLSVDLMDSQRPKGLDELALEQYEILLEEQAYPFEEKAIDLYKANTVRTQKGIYDNWVKASFGELAKILPARYGKKEQAVEVSDAIH